MLGKFFGGITVASLGASSFILFVTPHTNASRTVNLIGGYVFGVISGTAFSFLYTMFNTLDFAGVDLVLSIVCASAAAVTTFLMVWMRKVHPPAAALALGLAADPKSAQVAAAAVISVAILCVIRHCLSKHLINLI